MSKKNKYFLINVYPMLNNKLKSIEPKFYLVDSNFKNKEQNVEDFLCKTYETIFYLEDLTGLSVAIREL